MGCCRMKISTWKISIRVQEISLIRLSENYNATFATNYDTSSDKFQNYYKDISLRVKNREVDC